MSEELREKNVTSVKPFWVFVSIVLGSLSFSLDFDALDRTRANR